MDDGFTLIELLIAVAILVTLGALAYGGLNGLIRQFHQAEEAIERLAGLQRTVAMLDADFAQAQPRPVREEHHGDPIAAFIGGPQHEFALEFTRGGWSNPARDRRSTLQRVAWRLDGDRLERVHWRMLDRAPQPDVVVTPLLERVARIEWRFLDDQQEWQDSWPPAGQPDPRGDLMPRAVEVTIELENGDEVRRLFAIRVD